MKKKSKNSKKHKIFFYIFHLIRRLKEIMRIMGLNDSVHWFTWFVLCTTVMLFTAILLVIILKVSKSDKTSFENVANTLEIRALHGMGQSHPTRGPGRDTPRLRRRLINIYRRSRLVSSSVHPQ
jgi:hypothetical protein